MSSFDKKERIGTHSKTLIQNTKHFASNIEYCSSLRNMSDFDGVVGWGLKPSGLKALKTAEKYNIPILLIEDGFIRSLGLGIEGYISHSFIIDRSKGIFYNHNQHSDLETLINKGNIDKYQKQLSRNLINLIKSYKLSKYNLPQTDSVSFKNAILVVDQTKGDESIKYGGASAKTFTELLTQAIKENPNSEIIVKIHPDVICGKKEGHLLDLAKQLNCSILKDNVDNWELLNNVKKVYVVTSQFGFEALMANIPVVCYGMPFYAGWGLTEDKLTCSRRQKKRTVEEVFHAAYINYTNYVNPYTHKLCDIEDTIALISDQKRHIEHYPSTWNAVGFSSWKRKFIPTFIGPHTTINFTSKMAWNLTNTKSFENAVVSWSSKVTENFRKDCRDKNIHLWEMEDGFIRSVGLGADLTNPMSLVIDSKGIYYDASRPSDLEHLLNNSGAFDSFLLTRARRLRKRLIELEISKYNLPAQKKLNIPDNKKIILVPGQVETDASIINGTTNISTNHELLEAVRKDNNDAFIVYKPHPDVVQAGRYGEINENITNLVDLEILSGSMPNLLKQVDEVHTMTSLTGFEALLRNIKVVTYGMPFYAGWGLTEDKLICPRRNRKLKLEELVAGALIKYPIYVEPTSNQICNVETIIDFISDYKNNKKIPKPSLKTKLLRLINRVCGRIT